MDIYLLDHNKKITDAWEEAFIPLADYESNLFIVNDTLNDFLTNHPNIDGIVSPANSFGIMDGGYDKAIINIFGDGLQRKVRETLYWEFGGYQTPGTCFPIPIDRGTILLHTPSMRYPEEIADNRIIFDCMYNTIRTAMINNCKAIVIPAFGGCTGGVKPEIIAKYMRLGYEYALYRDILSNWDEVRTMRSNFYKADGSI